MQENQELSPETIRIVYQDCLYNLDHNEKKDLSNNDPDTHAEKATDMVVKSAGKNPGKKKFMVITDSAIVHNNSDHRFTFLSEIITACKLNMEDGYITNIGLDGKDHAPLLKQYEPDVVLLFGIGPSDLQLPMIFPNFQVQKIGKQIYLSAPSLELLEPDRSLKAKLWNCLKQAFSI